MKKITMKELDALINLVQDKANIAIEEWNDNLITSKEYIEYKNSIIGTHIFKELEKESPYHLILYFFL